MGTGGTMVQCFSFVLFLSCVCVLASGCAQDMTRARRANPLPSTARHPTASVQSAFMEFCRDGHSSSERATQDEIAYKGNTRTETNYGCNMMLVRDSIASLYDHTVNLTNASTQDRQCVCWLKIGPDGGVNGFFEGNQVLSFDLPAMESRVLAVDDDTQGGCACDVGGVATTPIGQFASTWLEFDVGNRLNGGWSGADASCLVAAANGMDIPGLQVCGRGGCSTIYPGGAGQNAYLRGMEDDDGVGIAIPAGSVRLTAAFGYTG